MQRVTFNLCTECEHCPELIIEDSGVTIGEAGNLVRLNHAEWLELVNLIRSEKVPDSVIQQQIKANENLA